MLSKKTLSWCNQEKFQRVHGAIYSHVWGTPVSEIFKTKSKRIDQWKRGFLYINNNSVQVSQNVVP